MNMDLPSSMSWRPPFIGEGEAHGYMVSRANVDDDMGVDTDQVEVVVVVCLDKSCSTVLGDDEVVLLVYVTTWPMVDRRLMLIHVRTYSRIRRVGSHWSADRSCGILAKEGDQQFRGLSR